MEATAVLAKNSSLLEYTGFGRIVNRSLAPVRASRGTVYCRPDCWTIGGVERAPDGAWVGEAWEPAPSSVGQGRDVH